MYFRDRVVAGRQLGAELARHELDRPVVLGLPRGGVPVAAEVARALGAPLDVLVVPGPSEPEPPRRTTPEETDTDGDSETDGDTDGDTDTDTDAATDTDVQESTGG